MTKTKLRRLLELRIDGFFYWKVDHKRLMIGDKAGTKRPDGTYQIQIEGKVYLAERLVDLYHLGHWPERKSKHDPYTYGTPEAYRKWSDQKHKKPRSS